MKTKSISEILEKDKSIYLDKLTTKSIPYYLDGLKPNYRRIIYAMYTINKLTPNKYFKTTELIGETIAKYHPYNEEEIIKVIRKLINASIFDGMGNFGNKRLSGNSFKCIPRNTMVRLNIKYLSLYEKVINCVPYETLETGYKIPIYLPTPIPLCLLISSAGKGYGFNTSYPTFTIRSLYNAYKKNDYNLLECPFDYAVKKTNILHSGKFTLKHSYHIELTYIDNFYGILITGSSEYFTPDLDDFRKETEHLFQGRVRILDLGDKNGDKLFITTIYNAKRINIEDFIPLVKRICSKDIHYNIRYTDGESIKDTSIYDWVDITYKNYLKLFKSKIRNDTKDYKNSAKSIVSQIIKGD